MLKSGSSPSRDYTQDRVNPRRSFGLMGLGAVTGLILAGYALFTAKGTSTLAVPPEDVALINQQPISRIDYLTQLQALYGTDLAHATKEERHKVLEDMIREELFVQRGKELDMASTDPEVRAAMVNAVEQMAAADAISATPSEAKLREYYQSNQDRFAREGRMTVRDLVFSAMEGAVKAEAALAAGQAADQVAQQNGGHESGRTKGEEFYFAAKLHLGDQLFDIARSLKDGALSQPVALADGVHILVMSKNVPPVPIEFAAARDQVLADFRNATIKHSVRNDEVFLRNRANILISEDVR